MFYFTITQLLSCCCAARPKSCMSGSVLKAKPMLHTAGWDMMGRVPLFRKLGLLLEADVGVRVGLWANVQTSLEKVSSGGHRGQRRRVAG